MTETAAAKSGKPSFSLRHLLGLTAIAAVWIAAGLAYQENGQLERHQSDLLSLTQRLIVVDPDRLQSAAYPKVAADFETWDVHIPAGEPMELRFAAGEYPQDVIPVEYDRIVLPPGRHRITLRAAHRPEDEFSYTVFVNGEERLQRSMGSDWMPEGWQQARGLYLPLEHDGSGSEALHLVGQAYTPRLSFPSPHHFSGTVDRWTASPLYRLWIDRRSRSYELASPFIGPGDDRMHRGIGLREGLRYMSQRRNQYQWEFTRPASRSIEPVLTVIPEFFVRQQQVVPQPATATSPQRTWWQIRSEPNLESEAAWQDDDQPTTRRIFLHADSGSDDAIQPVVELRWDAERPDEMGLRLPQLPANESLSRWRLRIIDGESQLWRIIRAGGDERDVRKDFGDPQAATNADPIPIQFSDDTRDAYRIEWSSDVDEPLQFLEQGRQRPNPYAGLQLFRGLPLMLGAELPASMNPSVSIVRRSKQSVAASPPIPGGAVIDQIVIELEAVGEDWLWLRVEPR